MKSVISINNVPIRLTEERWQHICMGHPEISDYFEEVLEAVTTPEMIFEGNNGGKIAVKELNYKKIIVVYKETSSDDGFVITAYLTTKIRDLQKRKILWKP